VIDEDDDITAGFHHGNPESTEAHASTSPEYKAKTRRKIYALAHAQGEYGITSDEAEQILGLSHQSCSARISELKREGSLIPKVCKIDPAKERRKTRSGRYARVLTVQEFPGR